MADRVLWEMIDDPNEDLNLLTQIKNIELDCGMSVDEVISDLLFSDDEYDKLSDNKLRKSLRKFGFVLTRDGFLFVADKSKQLLNELGSKKLWNQELKHVEGAKRSKYPKRFGTISKRGLLIPVDQILNTNNT